jgi:hypothetical protein
MAVAPADVQRVARRYLDGRKRVVAIVHPEQMSPGALAALGATPAAGLASKQAPPPPKKAQRKPRR